MAIDHLLEKWGSCVGDVDILTEAIRKQTVALLSGTGCVLCAF